MDNSKCWMKDNCSGIDCNGTCIRFIKMNTLYNEAGIPIYQRKDIKLSLIEGDNDCDIESYEKLSEINKSIADYIKSGKNLYLYSTNVGNGKTSWLLKMVQSYFNSIWPKCNAECKVLFIHVPTFLLALKDNISVKSDYIQHIKDNIIDCDLVVFDELTTRSGTNFELDHLLSYINTRLSYGKSCFYSSNVKPSELTNYLGDRLASRVVNLSEVVELKGSDMRYLHNL